MNRILIIDDNKNLANGLKRFLTDHELQAEIAYTGKDGLRKAPTADIILLDLKLPDGNGLNFLMELRKITSSEIIMITAFGTIEDAVYACKNGAFDFIQKPFKTDELLIKINNILQKKKLLKKIDILETENRGLREAASFGEIIGEDPKMRSIYSLIEDVAKASSSVFISGESGTGKELVAREIHKISKFKGAFVAVNCAALPANLLESELFGHEKGAFTGAYYQRRGRFEMTDNGTLFLDEIGDIPPEIQVKLLRVLQDGEFQRVGANTNIKVNVRLITATNKNIKELIENGKFREDLYYRINVINIHIPPLRERKEDIPLLANEFLKKYALKLNKKIKKISNEAMEALISYHWPGNVRELENIIERSVVLSKTELLDIDLIPEELLIKIESDKNQDFIENIDSNKGLITIIEDFERKMIIEALKKTKNNKSETARMLKIDRPLLYYKIKRLGIKV